MKPKTETVVWTGLLLGSLVIVSVCVAYLVLYDWYEFQVDPIVVQAIPPPTRGYWRWTDEPPRDCPPCQPCNEPINFTPLEAAP